MSSSPSRTSPSRNNNNDSRSRRRSHNRKSSSKQTSSVLFEVAHKEDDGVELNVRNKDRYHDRNDHDHHARSGRRHHSRRRIDEDCEYSEEDNDDQDDYEEEDDIEHNYRRRDDDRRSHRSSRYYDDNRSHVSRDQRSYVSGRSANTKDRDRERARERARERDRERDRDRHRRSSHYKRYHDDDRSRASGGHYRSRRDHDDDARSRHSSGHYSTSASRISRKRDERSRSAYDDDNKSRSSRYRDDEYKSRSSRHHDDDDKSRSSRYREDDKNRTSRHQRSSNHHRSSSETRNRTPTKNMRSRRLDSIISKETAATALSSESNDSNKNNPSDSESPESSATEQTNEIRRLLARRSPHLPNHGWFADWVQYMRNNHPLLGICCKYRENPIDMAQRVIMLFGSIFFGLAVTNYVYLYFKISDHGDAVFFKINGWGDASYSLTYETAVLWTLGSVVHTSIDLLVWHLAACSACLPGGYCSCLGCLVQVGRYLTIGLCVMFGVFGTIGIFMRANYDEAAGKGDVSVQDLTEFQFDNIKSFTFLIGYCVELFLVYFVYYPIIATMLFAGLIPFVGGRQRELNRQERNNELKLKNNDSRPLV